MFILVSSFFNLSCPVCLWLCFLKFIFCFLWFWFFVSLLCLFVSSFGSPQPANPVLFTSCSPVIFLDYFTVVCIPTSSSVPSCILPSCTLVLLGTCLPSFLFLSLICSCKLFFLFFFVLCFLTKLACFHFGLIPIQDMTQA